MATISELQAEIHDWAKEKGWWDQEPKRTFGDLIALCHSELSEALEEYRNDDVSLNTTLGFYMRDGKPEGIAIELADTVIRILDMCARYGINLENAIAVKMAYNRHRPYRHGGKAL